MNEMFKVGDKVRLKSMQIDGYFPSMLNNQILTITHICDEFLHFFDDEDDGWYDWRFERVSKSQKNHAWAVVNSDDSIRQIYMTRNEARSLARNLRIINGHTFRVKKILYEFA